VSALESAVDAGTPERAPATPVSVDVRPVVERADGQLARQHHQRQTHRCARRGQVSSEQSGGGDDNHRDQQ